MRPRLALMLIIALHAFGACAPTHAGARDAVASHEKAQELWQRNMSVVDESVEFWKKQTGTAPYTPKELENAIDFFETVTELRGRANMSFIGIIPDESLENASREWKAWYEAHCERLTYDASKKRADGTLRKGCWRWSSRGAPRHRSSLKRFVELKLMREQMI